MNDVDYDEENETTVVSGATEGLFLAIQAAVSAGDEVIVFDPAYVLTTLQSDWRVER